MKTGVLFHLAVMTALSITLVSCGKDQDKKDQELIEDYLDENQLEAESTDSGLYYIIDEPGTSEHPTLQDEITITYRGYLLNGNVFDEASAATFPLGVLIDGWQEGIPLFGKGGKGTLFIPSHLGYGNQSYPGIPANSVLVFDIELLDF